MHAVGGMFVLDCIASGAMWVDMQASRRRRPDQRAAKGLERSPCCALVMLSERARAAIDATTSTSFACDLRKWLQIMEAYENGGARVPRDDAHRLPRALRDVMQETEAYGFAKVRAEQQELGERVRALLDGQGFPSVAAEGFQAPGVVVSYTDDDGIQSGKKFVDAGLQIAPACRCNATSPPTSRPSASACSASTSCMTSKARWPGSPRPWTGFFRALLGSKCAWLALPTESAGALRSCRNSYPHASAMPNREHGYSGGFRSPPADAVAGASHAHMLRKSALKNTVQRLGEPGDRAFDVMQFVQAE